MRAALLTFALLASTVAVPGAALADPTTDFMLQATSTVLGFGAEAAALTGGFGGGVVGTLGGSMGGPVGPVLVVIGTASGAASGLGSVNPAGNGVAQLLDTTAGATTGVAGPTVAAASAITDATAGYWLTNAEQAKDILTSGLDKTLEPRGGL
ncbi:MAG: hypothetical protein LC624_12200 [Halobacteriales archaeon]|nr:hypothetical protein [Halobacteriales archaeon]